MKPLIQLLAVLIFIFSLISLIISAIIVILNIFGVIIGNPEVGAFVTSKTTDWMILLFLSFLIIELVD